MSFTVLKKLPVKLPANQPLRPFRLKRLVGHQGLGKGVANAVDADELLGSGVLCDEKQPLGSILRKRPFQLGRVVKEMQCPAAGTYTLTYVRHNRWLNYGVQLTYRIVLLSQV